MSSIAPSALAEHAFVRGLPQASVAQLAGAGAEVSFPVGHRLFEDGGPAERFWLVRTGRVALELNVPGPAPLIVDTLGPGDVIGLSWLAPHHRWQFAAVTVMATTAFEFDSAAVTTLLDSDPVLGYQIIRRLINVATGRLQAARIRLLDIYGLPSQHADAG
jgi:CRP/FNR family transcriptional regulator, cyclic AMP receptor protein